MRTANNSTRRGLLRAIGASALIAAPNSNVGSAEYRPAKW